VTTPITLKGHSQLLPYSDAAVTAAAAIIADGGCVAVPTETVYGLAADADVESAVRRVFAAKGRPADHPLIVHVADATAVEQWARSVPPPARLLADACWPGPLTLLLPRARGGPPAHR
jgi:L-threonylcarbamoyladenylate synthase